MHKWISKWWKSYKFRFVPWIAMNVKHHEPPIIPSHNIENNAVLIENSKKIIKRKQPPPIHGQTVPVHHLRNSEEKLITDNQLTELLINYFDKCKSANIVRGCEHDLTKISSFNKNVMREHFGFVVERRKSQISSDAGTGVFLAEGVARKNSVVALYCGTLYMPNEPLFFPSLGNKYIFRCSDNIHIDGNDKWISKSIYKSCSARDKFDFNTPACDTSWMTLTPMNPLNVGQYVNNRSHSHQNNVIYQECNITFELLCQPPNLKDPERGGSGDDVGVRTQPFGGDGMEDRRSITPLSVDEGTRSRRGRRGGENDKERDLDLRLRPDDDPIRSDFHHLSCPPTSSSLNRSFPVRYSRFLPNVWLNPEHRIRTGIGFGGLGLRIVPLVAIKDINKGEEILSSYFTVLHPDK